MKSKLNFRIAAALMLFAFFSFPLCAQPGPGQGPRRPMTEDDVKARVERLADTLQLNPAQEKQIMEYELEFYKKMQAERERAGGDREAMRAFMMDQREKRDAKYAEVLTPEQLKKYNAMMEQRRQQYQQRQGQGPEGERGRGRR
jgi:Spy/CpxP family protein refolding chaperone